MAKAKCYNDYVRATIARLQEKLATLEKDSKVYLATIAEISRQKDTLKMTTEERNQYADMTVIPNNRTFEIEENVYGDVEFSTVDTILVPEMV